MKKVLRVLLALVLAISLYGQFHYLLPWHKPLVHPTFTEKLLGDHYRPYDVEPLDHNPNCVLYSDPCPLD
jgi:hypothetical protein